jgi:hypothetical protein
VLQRPNTSMCGASTDLHVYALTMHHIASMRHDFQLMMCHDMQWVGGLAVMHARVLSPCEYTSCLPNGVPRVGGLAILTACELRVRVLCRNGWYDCALAM